MESPLASDSLDEVRQAARAGDMPGRAACTHAVETVAEVDATAARSAAAALPTRLHLQRDACDAEAATRNFSVTPLTWEQAGRMLFDSDPAVPVL